MGILCYKIKFSSFQGVFGKFMEMSKPVNTQSLGWYAIICFLDLKICIKNSRLETTVYSKPTDSHLYLEGSSCHKKSSKNGIIKGVDLLLCRICSPKEYFKLNSSEYMAYNIKHDLTNVAPINANHAVRNVILVIILLQVNHMWFSVLLEKVLHTSE